MFEEIFDVKRGRNLLDMFLSPTDDEGLLKDIERWKTSKIFVLILEKSVPNFYFLF